MTVTNAKIIFPDALAKRYRELLRTEANFAPENERRQYEIHAVALDDLGKEFEGGSDIEQIAVLLQRERRRYGWSFLSEESGEKVEKAFHEFATEIEHQIIKIKGKDWYCSKG